ncbi:MAG: outer membrane beta-barrel protein [Spirochaetaceae bacterium]|jgi:hypothetical protein|nr:outer membrane beta-barrel protein [Spirochaetaceae bacterium]
MIKKGFMVLVLAAFGAASVFTQDFTLSAGAGGFIDGDLGGGVEAKIYQCGQSTTIKAENPYFGGGAFAFFDMNYVELSLAFYDGGGKFKMSGGSLNEEMDASRTNLNIGLLVKYPFVINGKLTFFPLCGYEYQICLSAKDDKGEYEGFDGDGSPSDLSAMWIKLGIGMDFAFTAKVYLRFEALYGMRAIRLKRTL